jgi:hypothetical protein
MIDVPAAFLVYLFLLRHARTRNGRRDVRASLQSIASSTGLSKSTVQNALRHLRRRALLDPECHRNYQQSRRGLYWVRGALIVTERAQSRITGLRGARQLRPSLSVHAHYDEP